MTKPRMKSKTYKDGSTIFKQGIDNQAYDVGLMYHEPVNYSSHRFTFKLHYAKDGKRILCIKEDK